MSIIDTIFRLLVWCAGVDRQLLLQTPYSDRTKYANMGGLVLVPALLGFISMSYAAKIIPEIRDYQYLNYLVGLGWGCIIFLFDRYIVSTFRKSNSIAEDFKGLTFISRAVFSVVVGFIIADPLVLGIFAERIEKDFILQRDSEIRLIEEHYSKTKKNYEDKISALNKDKEAHETTVYQAEEIYLNELNGKYGKGSGVYGDGEVAKRKREILDRKLTEREQLKSDMNGQLRSLETSIAQLNQQESDEKAKIHIPTDYLARVETLDNLAMKHGAIRIRKYMWIILFVLIDLLPILYKVATKKEVYDHLLEKTIERAIAEINNYDGIYNDFLQKKQEEYRKTVKEGSAKIEDFLSGYSFKTRPQTASQSAKKVQDEGTEQTENDVIIDEPRRIKLPSCFTVGGGFVLIISLVAIFVFRGVVIMSAGAQAAANIASNAAVAAATIAAALIGPLVAKALSLMAGSGLTMWYLTDDLWYIPTRWHVSQGFIIQAHYIT